MKQCSKCGRPRPLSDFHRNKRAKDGRKSECRDCSNAMTVAWRRANPGRQAELGSQWAKANRERVNANAKRAREKHPAKIKARGILNRAVYTGKLAKPEHCESCGKKCSPHALHGHHEDYGKPLVVRWLCALCHRARH